MRFSGAAETTPANRSSSVDRGDSLPISARLGNAARTVDTDAQGKMVVLREGNNDFQLHARPPFGLPPSQSAFLRRTFY